MFVESLEMAAKSVQPPSREGLVSVTFWVHPEVRAELKRLAIDVDRTVASLLDEAVSDVLAKHRKGRRKT